MQEFQPILMQTVLVRARKVPFELLRKLPPCPLCRKSKMSSRLLLQGVLPKDTKFADSLRLLQRYVQTHRSIKQPFFPKNRCRKKGKQLGKTALNLNDEFSITRSRFWRFFVVFCSFRSFFVVFYF